MRTLAQASAILATLLGAGALLAIAAVGCGGDDTEVAQGDGSPGQTDGTTADHTTSDAKPDHKGDASTDGKKPEGDGGKPEDGTNGDGSGDDSSDAAGDGPREAALGDAPSDSDAVAPINPALLAFPNEVNTTYCERVAQCCGFDGGAGFNVAKCVSDNVSVGGIANVSVAQVDAGNIAYDEEAGTTCLNDIKSFNCQTLGDPLWADALNACSTAMQGTVGVNAGSCTSYWDCAAGSYCVKVDGGASHCATLGAIGTPCKDIVSSTDCSYRGVGAPPNHCSQEAGACEPALAVGLDCNYNSDCVSQLCDFVTFECQNTSEFTDPGVANGFCAGYTLP